MKEILISVTTILIISIGFNIYHSRKVDRLSDELQSVILSREVELDEFKKAIDNNKLAMAKLEEQKAKIVTKYIPISNDKLASCEDKLRAIESLQNIFFAVQ